MLTRGLSEDGANGKLINFNDYLTNFSIFSCDILVGTAV